MSDDPHDLLGVPRHASADEVKQAYRRLAKLHHPDHNGGDPASTARFRAIQRAYATLGGDDAQAAAGGPLSAGDMIDPRNAPGHARRGPISRRRPQSSTGDDPGASPGGGGEPVWAGMLVVWVLVIIVAIIAAVGSSGSKSGAGSGSAGQQAGGQ